MWCHPLWFRVNTFITSLLKNHFPTCLFGGSSNQSSHTCLNRNKQFIHKLHPAEVFSANLRLKMLRRIRQPWCRTFWTTKTHDCKVFYVFVWWEINLDSGVLATFCVNVSQKRVSSGSTLEEDQKPLHPTGGKQYGCRYLWDVEWTHANSRSARLLWILGFGCHGCLVLLQTSRRGWRQNLRSVDTQPIYGDNE